MKTPRIPTPLVSIGLLALAVVACRDSSGSPPAVGDAAENATEALSVAEVAPSFDVVPGAEPGASHPRVAVRADGSALVAWRTVSGWSGAHRMAMRSPEGTWAEVAPPPRVHQGGALDVVAGVSDELVAVWMAKDAQGAEVVASSLSPTMEWGRLDRMNFEDAYFRVRGSTSGDILVLSGVSDRVTWRSQGEEWRACRRPRGDVDDWIVDVTGTLWNVGVRWPAGEDATWHDVDHGGCTRRGCPYEPEERAAYEGPGAVASDGVSAFAAWFGRYSDGRAGNPRQGLFVTPYSTELGWEKPVCVVPSRTARAERVVAHRGRVGTVVIAWIESDLVKSARSGGRRRRAPSDAETSSPMRRVVVVVGTEGGFGPPQILAEVPARLVELGSTRLEIGGGEGRDVWIVWTEVEPDGEGNQRVRIRGASRASTSTVDAPWRVHELADDARSGARVSADFALAFGARGEGVLCYAKAEGVVPSLGVVTLSAGAPAIPSLRAEVSSRTPRRLAAATGPDLRELLIRRKGRDGLSLELAPSLQDPHALAVLVGGLDRRRKEVPNPSYRPSATIDKARADFQWSLMNWWKARQERRARQRSSADEQLRLIASHEELGNHRDAARAKEALAKIETVLTELDELPLWSIGVAFGSGSGRYPFFALCRDVRVGALGCPEWCECDALLEAGLEAMRRDDEPAELIARFEVERPCAGKYCDTCFSRGLVAKESWPRSLRTLLVSFGGLRVKHPELAAGLTPVLKTLVAARDAEERGDLDELQCRLDEAWDWVLSPIPTD